MHLSIYLRQGYGRQVDGKGRWIDDVIIEPPRPTVKHGEIHLDDHRDLHELERALCRWFEKFNTWRPHDSLDGVRPWEVHRPAGDGIEEA